MAKIVRYSGDYPAFGSTAQGTERTVFGDSAQSDTLTANINTDYQRGWASGVNENGFPPMQYFNGLGWSLSETLAYLHQAGVAEWDIAQEYFDGSLTIYDGEVYKSLVDSNTGNQPDTATSEWQPLATREGVLAVPAAGQIGEFFTQTNFRTGNITLNSGGGQETGLGLESPAMNLTAGVWAYNLTYNLQFQQGNSVESLWFRHDVTTNTGTTTRESRGIIFKAASLSYSGTKNSYIGYVFSETTIQFNTFVAYVPYGTMSETVVVNNGTGSDTNVRLQAWRIA